jgi:DNA-directed RNA polymerase specialized sigma24 family protein
LTLSSLPELQEGLLETVARLRAFATLLCMDVTLADELVATTLLRASVATPLSRIGQSLSTWLFSRLRNCYYTERAGGLRPTAQQTPPSLRLLHAKYGDTLTVLAELTAEEREALV